MNAMRLCYALIIGFGIFHLLLIDALDLGVDEAHYGLFALKLDWSYFDHPLMVGWLQVPAQVFGQSSLGLRLMPLLLMLLNSVLLLRITRKIAPHTPQVQLVALLLFYLSIITHVFGWGMVPDVPLMTWSLLVVALAVRLRGMFRWRDFVALGLVIGLAGITKYTAIVIPLALTIWLVREGQLLVWLRQWGLWLAVLIAAVCLTPVFYWNMRHDWISFAYQFEHGTEGSWSVGNFALMQALQALAYSPLLYTAGLCLCWRLVGSTFKKTKEAVLSSTESLLFTMAVLHLVLVGWSAGNGELLPHWAAVGWLLITPLCAQEVLRVWQRRHIALRVGMAVGGGVSVVLLLVLYTLIAFKPVALFPATRAIYDDVLGWKESAAIAADLAAEHNAQALWVENWSYASRIHWYSYASGLPVQVTQEKTNQYDLWYGRPAPDTTAILIEWKEAPKDTKKVSTAALQTTCRLLRKYTYTHTSGSIPINSYNFYLCR